MRDLKQEIKDLEDYNLKVIMCLSEFMSKEKLWDKFYEMFDKKYPGVREVQFDRQRKQYRCVL